MLLRVSHLNRSFSAGFAQYRSVVSATLVKELRDKSGCPMMECKKALSAEGVNGDVSLAMDWLRAKGIARASANADRVAKEGLIALNNVSSGSVVLLEVNSETDFLSLNSDFQDFVVMVSNSIGAASGLKGDVPVADILALKPVGSKSASHKTLQDSLGDVIASIRENIVLRRAEVLTNNTAGSVLSGYVHNKVGADRIPSHVQLGRAAAVVQLTVSDAALSEKVHTEVGRKLAMHTVAAKPAYLNPESVPREVIDRELSIFREQAASGENMKGKKPEVVEKIIQGKLSKRLSDITLLGQAHMAEEGGPVVKKFLEAYGKSNGNVSVELSGFALWSVGGQTV